MGKIYTGADWEPVIPMLGTMPDKDLADLVPMSQAVLCVKRNSLGIKPFPRDAYNWSDAESYMGKLTDCEIGRRFGIPQSTVTKRRQRLGIKTAPDKRIPRNEVYCPRGELSKAACLFAVRRWA